MDGNIEKRVGRHILLTIGIFCSIQLFLNFLDRSNMSYAALQMNEELGLDARAYGFAVGLYFVGHMLFCYPGAELAKRFGSRRTLGSIIIIWGTVAAAMGLVQNAFGLNTLRFLLGLAEASSAPVVTLLLTQWFPRKIFGRAMMLVTIAQPIGQLVGAPMSGFLMTYTDGWLGASGWRWMFGIEGLITVLFGIYTLYWLRDKPEEAEWLDKDEKEWLTAQLTADAKQAAIEAGAAQRTTAKDLLTDPKIWIFGLILFCIASGVYLFVFWLPQVLQSAMTDQDDLTIVLLSAIPWAGMMVGMLLFGTSSDYFNDRPFHLAAGMVIAAIGITWASANVGSAFGIAGLSLGAFGLGGAITVFWTMPPAYMAGTTGAGPAFAIINIIGNLTGIITPNLIGWLRDQSGGFESTLYMVILVLVFGTLLIIPVSKTRKTIEPTAALHGEAH